MFDTLFARLQKYLPPWFELTDAMNALLTGITNAINDVYTYAQTINTMWTSGKGMRLAAEDWGLWLAGDEADAAVVSMMQQRFTILQARGTAAGILSDVKTLTGDSSVTSTIDPSRGWVADVTFPDDEYVYADLDVAHVVALTYTNKSLRLADDIKAIIRQYLVPLNAFIFYN